MKVGILLLVLASSGLPIFPGLRIGYNSPPPWPEDDAEEVTPEAEEAAQFEPPEDHDDAAGDAWNRQNGLS